MASGTLAAGMVWRTSVVGPQVGVGGVGAGVALPGVALVLGLARSLVGRERHQLDLLVPLPVAAHLVWAVADRVVVELLERPGVLERRLRHRRERRVGQQQRELVEAVVQRDLQRGRVDHLEPRQLVALRLGLGVLGVDLGVPLDVREVLVGLVGVGPVGGVVPRVGEVGRLDRLAVVEGAAGLELDRPDLLVVALQRLRRQVDRLAVLAEPDQVVEQPAQDVEGVTAGGVARDQVVGLRMARGESAVGRRRPAAAGRQSERRRQRDRGEPRGPCGPFP